VNLKGEVVGINELGGSGVGFAIPSNLVAHVLNQALTYGEVRRGWLGISCYPVAKLKRDTGALIASVSPGSPADKAGLKPGDILLTLDGKEVSVSFFEEVPPLYKRIADLAPGCETVLRVLRGGKEIEAKVRVDRMEKYLGEEEEFRAWGLTTRGITGFMALARRYPDTLGALVTGVRPGLACDSAKPSLRRGDVILSLDGKPVEDLEAFASLVAAIRKKGEKKVLVRFRRNDEELLTVIDASKKEPEEAGGELPKAWIGIRTQVLTPDVARALGLKGKWGFRVTQVYPDTEAVKAGLKPGDIIFSLDGKFLKASRLSESELLRRRVEDLSIGAKATLGVFRGGAKTELTVVLEETPTTAAEVKTARAEIMEFTVRDVIFMDRVANKWKKGQAGVVVVEVTSGSWANLAGLRAGDLILSINDAAVKDVKHVKLVLEDLGKKKPGTVKIFVKRGYRTAFVFVEPEWDREEKKD